MTIANKVTKLARVGGELLRSYKNFLGNLENV